MTLKCRRCGHHFGDDEGRAGVYIEQPWDNISERLAGQEVVQLCGECASSLRAWIGMAPLPDPAAPAPLHDDRLADYS